MDFYSACDTVSDGSATNQYVDLLSCIWMILCVVKYT